MVREYVYGCHVSLEKRELLSLGVYGDQVAKGVITEENERVWREYLNTLVKEHLKPEMMETSEFKDAIERVMNEEEREKRRLQKKTESKDAQQRRSYISKPRINFIPRGLKVDYEEEYGKILDNAITFEPANSDDFVFLLRYLERWYKKSIPQFYTLHRPDAAYAVAIDLCRHIPLLINRDDLLEYVKTYKSRIKRMIVESFKALVNAVKAWNNEEKRRYVCNFIFEESKQYREFRGIQRTLIEMMPSEAFSGEPVSVMREMNDDELREQQAILRKKAQEERMRIEAEKEAKSVIQLNQDYETRIFNTRNISWDCDIIAHEIFSEEKRIEKVAGKGDYMQAALMFMQLTKSMCRHFISDEHFNYFDDMYSPEYAIESIADFFMQLQDDGKLPSDVQEYLHKAWVEIQATECCEDYGILGHRSF